MPSQLNLQIAERLEEVAILLEQQDASPFRVAAYRHAADTVSGLDEDLGEILETRGVDGLVALPGIGDSIAAAVREMLRTGRWSQLDRLRGGAEPEALLRTVPGIGPGLAHRVHERLDIDTLEALETAAHDGRLATVPGFGRRRIRAVAAALATMLGRVGGRVRRAQTETGASPPVALILAVDEAYRDKAAAGHLPTVAPRRFNPEGKAWLPILHADRQGWHFTALFSNTARAHELGRTHDWVVIFFYDGDHREGQHTVVTEGRGRLAGRRVVRGREAECAAFYGVAADHGTTEGARRG
jgi:putative hydrolase